MKTKKQTPWRDNACDNESHEDPVNNYAKLKADRDALLEAARRAFVELEDLGNANGAVLNDLDKAIRQAEKEAL